MNSSTAERPVVNGRVKSSNLFSSAEILKIPGQVAPMVEHCVEAATVQVRILFCPQKATMENY
jgi:hypothetical protein